jgi:hypothetical protein
MSCDVEHVQQNGRPEDRVECCLVRVVAQRPDTESKAFIRADIGGRQNGPLPTLTGRFVCGVPSGTSATANTGELQQRADHSQPPPSRSVPTQVDFPARPARGQVPTPSHRMPLWPASGVELRAQDRPIDRFINLKLLPGVSDKTTNGLRDCRRALSAHAAFRPRNPPRTRVDPMYCKPPRTPANPRPALPATALTSRVCSHRPAHGADRSSDQD